jgi:hypothetical protein
MSVTWADVQVIAPELTNTAVPTGTQAVLLEMVDRQIDDDVWLDLADDGRRYLAAHMGTIYVQTSGGGAASVGTVSSETVGPMSRSYVTNTSSASTAGSVDAMLGTTRYGIWYLHMIRLLPSLMGFVA